MINFRYHVVSLTAVFLALAIGLVVGTAALNGPLSDSLSNQVRALSQDNQRLREQVNHLETDVNQREQFAADAAPLILANRLAGERILLVSMSSANKYRDGVRQMLTTAGATIAAQVEIQDKFTDPANNETLLDIASTAPMSSVSLPTNSNGAETSSALLAAVLMRPKHGSPVSASVIKTVLTAYSQAGFITIDGQVNGVATAIVMVAGAPYTDQEATQRNAAELTIVDQLDKAGPLVVAADSTAGAGNVVAALRGDPTLSKVVSTVDNVATVQGQVATALVCAYEIAGKTGHYGVGAGSTSLIPKSQT